MKQKKVWLNGYSGRMGSLITKELEKHQRLSLFAFSDQKGWALASASNNNDLPSTQDIDFWFSQCELIIDFSSQQGNLFIKDLLKKNPLNSKAVLIGSTGIQPDIKNQWINLAKKQHLSLLFAPNTSLGILLTLRSSLSLAKSLRGKDFDIEILESHHRHKIDSPSGTARFLANHLADQENLVQKTNRSGKREREEIGVVALRGGSVFGEHTIRFMGDDEEIEITHRALNRNLFVKGALILAEWIINQKPGIYELPDVNI